MIAIATEGWTTHTLTLGSMGCKERNCWHRSPRYQRDADGRTRCIRCGSANVAEVLAPKPPQRIQRRRTKGWKMPPNTVYVGRPGYYGNPFTIGDRQVAAYAGRPPRDVTDAATAVALYRDMADAPAYHGGALFRQRVQRELRGKTLACWCPLDQPCHADVLLELANA